MARPKPVRTWDWPKVSESRLPHCLRFPLRRLVFPFGGDGTRTGEEALPPLPWPHERRGVLEISKRGPLEALSAASESSHLIPADLPRNSSPDDRRYAPFPTSFPSQSPSLRAYPAEIWRRSEDNSQLFRECKM
ncbi:hypothetical protein KM043_005883 [Ampulex compressa]|nr:hypothetical protein KM043_005883 [Ampulex compressa]